MTDQQDISQYGKGHLPEEKLLAYLEGRLSPAEQREVEALLAEEGMESDALEGLQQLPADKTRRMAERINYRLQHDLKKNRHRGRKHFSDNKWSWLAILLVLILTVLAYFVIRSEML
jgi:anti-sigma factor RsiW